jgi:TolB-like protein/predicted Ser/Thr protein kinase
MVDQVLGHYRVLEKIGSGGRGVVYRAHDDRLDRDVAVKVLPAGTLIDDAARKRFHTEALALSKLNHPNIATVHDFDTLNGTDFLVMELVRGETLVGRLRGGAIQEEEVLTVGMQIGQALEDAHEHGVVHCDLKPGNIMITAKGQVKVLDFGLAKFRLALSDTAATESLTKEEVIGTLPYMAPEQLRGSRVDQRCDIYSFGVVLYEMATGQCPFQEKVSTALADDILHKAPPVPGRLNPDISSKLEEIILKCLEKSPEDRYQSAKEVGVDLRRLRRDTESSQIIALAETSKSSGLKRKPWLTWYLVAGMGGLALLIAVGVWRVMHSRLSSRTMNRATAVAVLPFQNIGSDKSRDFLRFAVPDEVVSTLSYIPSLAIRPFSTTRQYDQQSNLQTVGRDLRVANIVTGHYLEEGDQLRVTVEAIDVESNRLIWQQTVSGSTSDMIPLQEKIAARVRQGLVPALGVSTSSAASGSRPKNSEAYDLYQRSLGIPLGTGPNKEGISLLERALKLDDSYAPAWVALGHRYYDDGSFASGGHASFSRSTEAFQRALALDPDLIDPAAQLINRHLEQGRLESAYDEVEALLQRRPQSAKARYTVAYVLRYGGLLDESAGECDTASALDPGDEGIGTCIVTFMLSGKYDRAMSIARAGSQQRDFFPLMITEILLRQGRPADALRALPNTPNSGAPLLHSCIEKQPLSKIAALAAQYDALALETPDSDPKYFQGAWDSYCGLRENALRMLRRVVEQNNCIYPAMDNDPLYAGVRGTPEFAEIRKAARACRDRFAAYRTLQQH